MKLSEDVSYLQWKKMNQIMVDNQELEYCNSLFIYLPWTSFIFWNSDKSYEENQCFQM